MYTYAVYKQRVTAWLLGNSNTSQILHFTIGTGNHQIYFDILGLIIGHYNVDVVISSTLMCAMVTGNSSFVTQSKCISLNNHYKSNNVLFKRNTGDSNIFKVTSPNVVSCGNCIIPHYIPE